MARAGPLGGEDLPTSAATPSALYLPPEQHAALPASVAVTAVTDLLFGYPIIFGRRVTEEAPGENATLPTACGPLKGAGWCVSKTVGRRPRYLNRPSLKAAPAILPQAS